MKHLNSMIEKLSELADVLKEIEGESTGEDIQWLLEMAERHNSAAQLILGAKYMSGAGVPEHHVEGFKWYFKAAQKGRAKAQALLPSATA